MKITINLDVTPQEARTFFGLPDVKPLQDEMLGKVREKILSGAEGFDPVSLLKPFFPQNVQTLEAMQKSFWQALAGKTGATAEQAPPGKPPTSARARDAKVREEPAKSRTGPG